MNKFISKNGVLSSALLALYKIVGKADSGIAHEVDLSDAITLQECASVIARSSAYEVLSALKGIKEVGYIKSSLNQTTTAK